MEAVSPISCLGWGGQTALLVDSDLSESLPRGDSTVSYPDSHPREPMVVAPPLVDEHFRDLLM